MANKKFSEFVLKTDTSDVSHIVGYNGAENVQITPANFVTTGGTGVFLPLAGGTMVGNTIHNDNVKSIYGTASDGLEVYHDGTHSYIKDTGTGDLKLQASNDIFLLDGSGNVMLEASENGSVDLFYNGAKKFETTNTGISVTGTTDTITSFGSTYNQQVHNADSFSQAVWKVGGVAKALVGGNATGMIITTAGNSTAPIIFSTGSTTTERMRIDASGNLGIGTSSDLGKVTIQNDTANQYALRILRSTSTTQGLGGFYEGSSNQGELFLLKGDNTISTLINSDGDSYLNGGNLGVGTSTPLSFGAGSHLVTAQGDAGNNYGGFIARTDNVTGQMWATEGGLNFVIGTRTNHDVLFSINGAEKMRLDTSGNLGIGAADAAAYGKFLVNGTGNLINANATSGAATFQLYEAGAGRFGIVTLNGTAGAKFTLAGAEAMRLDSSGKLQMQTSGGYYLTENTTNAFSITSDGANGSLIFTDEYNSSERMRINSDGLVTINPGTASNTSYDALVLTGGVNSTTGSGAKMYLSGTANDPLSRGAIIEGLITDNSNGHALKFYTSAASSAPTERMRLTSTGDLLVGTTAGNVFNRTTANDGGVSMMATSSGVRIDAARDGVCYTGNRPSTDGILFDIRRSGVTVGAISVTETATTYSTASDYRLKEDLQDFKGLDLVSKIPVYDYKWKADDSRSYGVMAHELEEVLPQAVTGEKDAEEMQSVDYSKIVPLLVKSIQELSAKLEALECQCEKK